MFAPKAALGLGFLKAEGLKVVAFLIGVVEGGKEGTGLGWERGAGMVKVSPGLLGLTGFIYERTGFGIDTVCSHCSNRWVQVVEIRISPKIEFVDPFGCGDLSAKSYPLLKNLPQ